MPLCSILIFGSSLFEKITHLCGKCLLVLIGEGWVCRVNATCSVLDNYRMFIDSLLYPEESSLLNFSMKQKTPLSL
jgi:hypothetical protein